jgi:hypothetical protein
MRQTRHLTIACLVLTAITGAGRGQISTCVNWESPQIHSVEVTPNGATLPVTRTINLGDQPADVAMMLLSLGEFGGAADQGRSGIVDAGDMALIMLDFGACAN